MDTPNTITVEIHLTRIESLGDLADSKGVRRMYAPYFHLIKEDNKLLYEMIKPTTDPELLKKAVLAGQVYVPTHALQNWKEDNVQSKPQSDAKIKQDKPAGNAPA